MQNFCLFLSHDRTKMPNLTKGPDVKQDAQMPRQQDAQMPRQQDAQMPRQQDAQMPRQQDAQADKMTRCPARCPEVQKFPYPNSRIEKTKEQILQDQLTIIISEIIQPTPNGDYNPAGMENLYQFIQKYQENFPVNQFIENILGPESPLKLFIDFNLAKMYELKQNQTFSNFINCQITSKMFEDVFGVSLNKDPRKELIKFGHDNNINWREIECLPYDKSEILVFPEFGNDENVNILNVTNHFKTIGLKIDEIYKDLGINYKIVNEENWKQKEQIVGSASEPINMSKILKTSTCVNTAVLESMENLDKEQPVKTSMRSRLREFSSKSRLPGARPSSQNNQKSNDYYLKRLAQMRSKRSNIKK